MLVYVGQVCMWNCQQYRKAISPSVHALVILGSTTQIGSFLLAKASKEGDIRLGYHWNYRAKLCQ
jgi:hypothetical protein